jgi:hypothetical protein
MVWDIDGSLTFSGGWVLPTEQATDPPTYEYNVMVMSQDGLTDGEHRLDVYITHNQPNFIVRFFLFYWNYSFNF